MNAVASFRRISFQKCRRENLRASAIVTPAVITLPVARISPLL
jgi:hypothetical protein